MFEYLYYTFHKPKVYDSSARHEVVQSNARSFEQSQGGPMMPSLSGSLSRSGMRLSGTQSESDREQVSGTQTRAANSAPTNSGQKPHAGRITSLAKNEVRDNCGVKRSSPDHGTAHVRQGNHIRPIHHSPRANQISLQRGYQYLEDGVWRETRYRMFR